MFKYVPVILASWFVVNGDCMRPKPCPLAMTIQMGESDEEANTNLWNSVERPTLYAFNAVAFQGERKLILDTLPKFSHWSRTTGREFEGIGRIEVRGLDLTGDQEKELFEYFGYTCAFTDRERHILQVRFVNCTVDQLLQEKFFTRGTEHFHDADSWLPK